MISVTFTTAIATTVYYYFGYLYTYLNNDMVSLYGIDNEEFDVVFIPDTLNERKLVDIRNNAFKDNTDIRLIDFGGASNLERIGSFAFSGCTNATGGVIIPSNVVVIETGAFQGCTALDTVTYNANCNVPNQCFMGCSALSSVTLCDSVVEIGDYAFADCPNLAYIEIPSTVESIADTAFQNDEVTLGVYYNSDAHLFALDNDIEYVILDPENIPPEPPTGAPTDAPTEAPTDAPTEPGYILGDADGDGEITTIDVTYIQRYDVLMDLPTPIIEKSADVDGDGEITIIDATYIQRYIAQFDIEYPVGQWIPLS